MTASTLERARQECVTPGCGHIYVLHKADGDCRVNGCRCEEFTGGTPAPVEKPSHRKVCVDVPDGYGVTFSVLPLTADDPAKEPA
jgi:hypothetical protein